MVLRVLTLGVVSYNAVGGRRAAAAAAVLAGPVTPPRVVKPLDYAAVSGWSLFGFWFA